MRSLIGSPLEYYVMMAVEVGEAIEVDEID